MNTPSLTAANKALAKARVMRGEWLVAIHEETVTVHDAVAFADTAEGSPLRRLRLDKMLAAQPGWGDARVRRTLDLLIEFCDATPPAKPLTVAWLLHRSCRHRRLKAWLDLLTLDRDLDQPVFDPSRYTS